MPDIIITRDFIKDKIEIIKDPMDRAVRKEAFDRWMFFNGNVQPIIKSWIEREFKKPETVEELTARIVPINIVKKIINKLAAVYTEPPLRNVADGNESDQEMLQLCEDVMKVNVNMKLGNNMFKLDKKLLTEIFVNENGMPQMRHLPAYTYKVFSHSMINPEIPDTVMKLINPNEPDETKQRFIIWTERQFLIVDGKGDIRRDLMEDMGNPDGINPFETLPFIYMADNMISVDPIDDDDLLKTSIAINVLMSDLLFASKYQSWSLIWTVGFNGDLPMNPNSVVHIDRDASGEKPEINQLKPEIDTQGALRLIEALTSMLLSSRNLSTKSISNQLSVDNIQSGVSKAIDQSEVLEERKGQQDVFLQYEQVFWDKLAFNMIPVWRQQGLLSPELNKEFSEAFEVILTLREPQVMLSEMERIDIESKKLLEGLTTLRRSLQVLNPDMGEEEIDALILEIEEDKANKVQPIINEMQPEEQDGEEDSEENEG